MAASAPITGLDTKYVLTGFQGELWDGNGNFLAEVNTFRAQFNITNADYQPAGRAKRVGIMTGFTQVLTLTETVIRDTQFLQHIWRNLYGKDENSGADLGGFGHGQPPLPRQPIFNFQGYLYRRDGTIAEYLFEDCVPDGSQDIINVGPGEVLARAWSWRVNGDVNLVAILG